MQIEYLGHFGDDLMVVDAARVSFDKKSEWEYPNPMTSQKQLSEKDQKLIKYLLKDKTKPHFSPFTHPQLQVRVTAPIFIANQLKRHQVGLAVNEVSRRYVDDEPKFYTPEYWRGRPDGSIKQGSSYTKIDWIPDNKGSYIQPGEEFEYFQEELLSFYNRLIEGGVAPEMARMVLPQATYTSWIWTGSLMAFLRIYQQRIDSHAQLEVQEIAKQLGEILKTHFPYSFEAFTNEKV